ncbi:hypothetical protein [Sphingomonas sp. MMS24-J13]|uniref:hypothetical protein n=1 Tax=Sphingomonas sp. MMS24-J13 TaxID=3238686 RepID=UPI00384E40A4
MKRIVLTAPAAIMLCIWAWHAIGRLGEARRAQAAARGASQVVAVTAALRLPATTAAEAQPLLAKQLGDAASATGVRLSLSPLASRLDGLVSVRIEAHGPEDRLRAFAEAAESATSPLRFVTWSIAADGAGALQLKAEAAAPWRAATAGATLLEQADPAPQAPARTLFAVDAPQDARPVANALPELIGIAGRLPHDAVALVRLPGGATRNLRIGETAGGWRLTTIAADRARFARGADQREVVLPPRE